MKKYSVQVKFKNGQDLKFETDTNVKLAAPHTINGERCIVTENEYVLNLRHVEKIKQIKL